MFGLIILLSILINIMFLLYTSISVLCNCNLYSEKPRGIFNHYIIEYI